MQDFIQTGTKWTFNEVLFLERSHCEEYIAAQYHIPNQELLNKSPYLIISATGAIGKSAFARHLVKTKNAMLWDLSKLRLGSNTFVGSLVEAVGPIRLSEILDSIKLGETTLVFDAVDEAELHSGWNGVTSFIKDIVQFTTSARNCSVIFISRRDTAELIELTLTECLKDQQPPATAQIGYFCKKSSIDFIFSEIKRYKGQEFLEKNKIVLKEKACEAISMSLDGGTTLSSNEVDWINKEQEKFFGYAPVLQTISRLLAETNNTYTLKFNQGTTNKASIVLDIIDKILKREQEKFLGAAKENSDFETSKIDLQEIYSPNDQINRLTGLLLNDNNIAFAAPPNIDTEQQQTFSGMVKAFLPQHPFLDGRDFAGPAFRDYLLAVALLSSDRLGAEMLIEIQQPLFSPIFSEIYSKIGNGVGHASDIEIIYESANSSSRLHKPNLALFVNEDDQDNLIVEIYSDAQEEVQEDIKLSVKKPDVLFFYRRLINAKISIDGKLVLGRHDMDFEISSSEIFANHIQINAGLLRIRNTENSQTIIKANIIQSSTNLRINSKSSQLVVDCPNSNTYPWTEFSSLSQDEEQSINAESMLHVVARILSWFRKDRRDEYGRYKDLIRKHAVGKSRAARHAIGYLNSIGALYERGNLYFINSNSLDENEISWTMIRSGNPSSKATNSIQRYLLNNPEPPQI